ncbi:MAG: flippase-like domain-containing protein [Gemmatimonadota bacterium]|nr:flippase-like domain-containing protein [Gemmatimonadota bacterium]MDH3368239.1 flippase-like domain-containing protein [Gemmatimonadota bacterium]MDH3478644.1 flippase-like domain-containing protein [Gemmatimonadota bacterium]MDH3571896.1 flippase-like domain-containing protein [Gemmatimonadota bacterium]MDH5548441.1 flippase-like domain-containing protein [Gemmatimonadota bacterium]
MTTSETSSKNSSISSTSGSRTKPASRGFGWSGLLGIVVSLLLLWWALHDVSPREVWANLRGVRPVWLVATVVLATAAFPARAVRWRYLLRLEGETLPLGPLWHGVAIGFMANNLLPARAGELARAYTARRLTDVRFTTALASIAVERVLDGLTLVAFLVTASWAGGFSNETVLGDVTVGSVARGAGALFGGVLLAAILIVRMPDLALRFAGAATRILLPAAWRGRALDLTRGLLLGFEALRSPARLVAASLWSLGVWLLAAASFWAGFRAFGIDAPWATALLAQALVGFGVAIPSSPGFFGPFEAAVKVSLALYAVGATSAVSFAVGYHITTFIPITLLGIWSLSRAQMHLAELREASASA